MEFILLYNLKPGITRDNCKGLLAGLRSRRITSVFHHPGNCCCRNGRRLEVFSWKFEIIFTHSPLVVWFLRRIRAFLVLRTTSLDDAVVLCDFEGPQVTER